MNGTTPRQRRTQALDPHLCRCTGYVRYYEAVRELILAAPGLVRG
jgi:xanthine dehydrogenase YagT iron-sulfur-binding subunit